LTKLPFKFSDAVRTASWGKITLLIRDIAMYVITIHKYHKLTDGRTNKLTDKGHTIAVRASRGKKN